MSTLEIQAVELTVPLESIRRDEALICRARGVDARTVKEYAEAMKGGATFPPVVAFRDAKGVHWLADGFHRCGAAELAGRAEIPADVREGGRREALLHAASSNAAHGLRRTNADKRHAVELVLRSFGKWSDRKIGDACGVDGKTVASVRKATAELPQSDEDAREGADGKVRKAAAFDGQREIAKLEKTILALAERWPDGDNAGLAELAARVMAMATCIAPAERPRRTVKAKAKANGAAHETVEAATG